MHATLTSLRLALLGILWMAAPAIAFPWTDDYDQAVERAKAEGKPLLLNFTGSDWCGWCVKLDTEVFSQSAFKTYARDNLVCVTVDFPRGKKLNQRLRNQNERLAKQFGVRGYPTIYLADPDGNPLARTGYLDSGADHYVEHLKGLLEPHAGKFTPSPSAAAPDAVESRTALRTWTSASGSTVEARYDQRVGTTVHLRREDGGLIRIDLDSLSEADHDFLRAIRAL